MAHDEVSFPDIGQFGLRPNSKYFSSDAMRDRREAAAAKNAEPRNVRQRIAGKIVIPNWRKAHEAFIPLKPCDLG